MTIKKLISGLLAVGMLTSMVPTALMEQEEPAPGAQVAITADIPEEEAASGAVENAVPEADEQLLDGGDEGESVVSGEAPRTDDESGEALPGGDGEELPSEGGDDWTVEENASARADFEIDDNLVITRYVGEGGDVIVPDDIVGIGEKAFASNTKLNTIKLPYGMTSIAANAFSGCSNLTSVGELPDTLTTVGDYAFADCGSLTAQLPESLVSIGERAFSGTASLGDVTITEKMETVTRYAFAGSSMNSLTIEDGVKAIEPYAFAECTGLSSLTIPKTVEKVADHAFYKSSVTSVKLTNGVKEVGAYAFAQCGKLKSLIVPVSLETIGEYAFAECALNDLNLEEGVKTIGAHAFEGCGDMSSVTIPKGVKAIGDSAFENSGVTTLKVLGNVNSMGKKAFANCVSLNNPDLSGDFNALSTGIFSGCTGMKTANLPMSVTAVPEAAFSGCSNLETVQVKSSVTEIMTDAFKNCGALKSIGLPANLKTIGESAFSGCGLTEVKLPDGVTALADYAFENCASMTKITFNDKLAAIGEYAFSGCALLSNGGNVELPTSMTTVGRKAFENCTGIESVSVSDKTTAIAERAFYGCSNLKSILIPATVTSIGAKAFENCHDDLEIRGETDSVAEQYARDNDIGFSSDGVEQEITIALIPGNEPTKVYDGTTKIDMKADAFKIEGVDAADEGKVKISAINAEFDQAAAGARKVTVSFEVATSGGSHVYKLKRKTATFEGSITQKDATVTPDANQGKSVGAQDPELTYKCDGLLEGDVLTGNLGREEGEKTGEYKFTLNTLENKNYKLTLKGDAVFTIRELDFEVAVRNIYYNGSKVTPTVTVTDSSNKETLTKDTDYTLEYSDNIEVGIGKVTVTGQGKYKGVNKTATFRIIRKFIYEDIPAQKYMNGNEIKPAVAVKDAISGAKLVEGTDYSLTYSNNKEIGTGEVSIKGEGDYKGDTKKVTFRISKPFTATLAQTVYTYTGYAITPRPTVKDGATTLTTAQYSLTYANNIAAGLATVTVTGAKDTDYEGYTQKLSFTIESSDVPTPSTDEVELDKSKKVTVYVDDVFDITIPDYDATKFKSSKSSVASVDEGGTVTCLKEGKAKITVTLENKKKRTLTLNVEDPNKVTKMYFEDKSTVNLDVEDEDSEILVENLVVEPMTAEPELEWKSSDKKVLEVDKESGTLTPRKEGKATITVTDKKSKKSAKIKVKVTNLSAPKRLYFEEGSSIEVDLSDGSVDLQVLAETESGEDPVTEYKWSSSKSSVAAVDKEETGDSVSIELKKKGSAKITVKSDNGKKASIKIKVTDDSED